MLRQASHDAGEVLSMTRDDEASRGKLGRLSRQAVGAGGGVVGFDGLMPNVELHGLRPPEIGRGASLLPPVDISGGCHHPIPFPPNDGSLLR